MARQSTVFLVITIIALLQTATGQFVAISFVSGWHMKDYPPYFIVSIVQLIWILILPVLYRLREKRNNVVIQWKFILHVVGTLSYFISFDSLFILPALVPLMIFIATQMLFLGRLSDSVGIRKLKLAIEKSKEL